MSTVEWPEPIEKDGEPTLAMDKPQPPPEALLLRRVRTAAGIRAADAAAAVARNFRRRFSASRWSQIEVGYESRAGAYRPVRASAGTLAQMAHALPGITPERLAAEGQRPDAAEVLTEILRAAPPPAAPATSAAVLFPEPPDDAAALLFPGDAGKRRIWRMEEPEETRVALLRALDEQRRKAACRRAPDGGASASGA